MFKKAGPLQHDAMQAPQSSDQSDLLDARSKSVNAQPEAPAQARTLFSMVAGLLVKIGGSVAGLLREPFGPKPQKELRRRGLFRPGFATYSEALEPRVYMTASPFIPGDIVVVQIGTGSAQTTSNATQVFLDEYTPSGALVQQIALSTSNASGAIALTASGTASGSGQISLSPNGQDLAIFGYNDSTLTANTANQPESVGIVGANGTISYETSGTSITTNANGVAISNGNLVYIGGNSGAFDAGTFSNGATSITGTSVGLTNGNSTSGVSSLEVLNGELFGSSGKLGGIWNFGSTLPAAAGNTAVELTTGTGTFVDGSNTALTAGTGGGATASYTPGSPNGFFFANLGSGNYYDGYDTLYVADTDKNGGAILKYSYNANGNWTYDGGLEGYASNGNATIVGVTGTVSGTTVNLEITAAGSLSSNSTVDAGDVYTVSDNTGFGGNLSSLTLSNAVINANSANIQFRGISQTPDDGNGTLGGFGSTNYTQGFASIPIDSAATFADSSNFDGGNLTISGALANDTLSIANAGGVTVSGNAVSYNGSAIGNITAANGANGGNLTIAFNPVVANEGANYAVTGTEVQALIDAVTFNSTTSSTAGSRTIKFTVGENNGNTTSGNETVNVSAPAAPTTPFTPGDVVVVQVGANGATAALTDTGTAVYLDEYTPSGQFVQQIAIPTTANGANAPFVLGNNDSEGLLNLSTDGKDLLIAGYGTTVGGAGNGTVDGDASNVINRVVGVIGANGSIDTTTSLTDAANGANVREVAGSTTTGFYVAGQDNTKAGGGVRYATLGGNTSIDLYGNSVPNGRGVEIWNGQVYFSQDKITTDPIINAIDSSSGSLQLPTASGATVNLLPGTGTTNLSTPGSNSQTGGFFFAKLGTGPDFQINGADSGYDTLYVADTDNKTTGDSAGITKYSWTGTAWVNNGTVGSSTLNFEGLTGTVSGGVVTLYATFANPASGASSAVYSITDGSGFNGSLTATPTVLANTAILATNLGEVYRGLALAPDDGAQPINGLGGTTNYTTGNPATIVGGSVTYSDTSSFNGGSLVISGGQTGDVLSVVNQGTAGGQIGVSSGNVTYGGIQIGTLSGGTGTTPLTITFDSVVNTDGSGGTEYFVTSNVVQALINQVTFSSTGANGDRTLTFTVNKNSPTNLAGAYETTTPAASDAAVATQTVNVGGVVLPPPTIAQSGNIALEVSAGQQTVNLTGITEGNGTGQTLTVTASSDNGNLIANGSISVASIPNANGTDTLTFTPTASASGTANITVTVSDANGNTTDTFEVTVVAPPTVTPPANAAFFENASNMTIAFGNSTVSDNFFTGGNITVNVSDLAGNLTVATGVSGGVANSGISHNGTGNVTLTGTPTAIDNTLHAGVGYQVAANTTGSDTLTITANDTGNTAVGLAQTSSATANIAVNAPGVAPSISANLGFATPIGTTTTLGNGSGNATFAALNANDADYAAADLTYTLTLAPTDGTLTNGNATLGNGSTFTQAAINAGSIKYTSTTSGNDTVSVTVSDPTGQTASANLSITVDTPTTVSFNPANSTTYTQNFDALANVLLPGANDATTTFTGTGPFDLVGSNTALPLQGIGANPTDPAGNLSGWSVSALANGPAVKYANETSFSDFVLSANGTPSDANASNPMGNSGAVFNYGNSPTSTNRALGLTATTAADDSIDLTLVNTGNTTINNLTIQYTGEQWHGSNSTNDLLFSYKLGNAAFANDANLTFFGNQTTTTNYTGNAISGNFSLDGSQAGNQANLSDSLANVGWAPGETLVLNWELSGATKSAGDAIDNFKLTAQSTPTVTVSDAGGTYTGNAFPATGLSNGNATLDSVATTLTYYDGTGTGGTNLGNVAPSAVGTYTVVATFPGSSNYASASSTPLTFSIAQATPTVNVTDAGGQYNGSMPGAVPPGILASFPATATVAGVNGIPGSTLETVGTTLTYYVGSGTGGTNLGSTAPSAAGTYTVVASFAGSTSYTSATNQTTFTITPANITISAPMIELTPSSSTQTGFFDVLISDSDSVDKLDGFQVDLTTPDTQSAVTITSVDILTTTTTNLYGSSASYVFSAFGSAGGPFVSPNEATNSDGPNATPPVGPALNQTYALMRVGFSVAPNATGNIPLTLTPFTDPNFPTFIDLDNGIYSGANAGDTTNLVPNLVNGWISILATPTVTVSDAGGTYNGSPFPATAKVNGNATLETVGTTLTYYSGTGTGGTNLGSTAPIAAGTYTVVASFPGSTDFNPALSTPLTFTIAQATPTVTVTDAGGTYDGTTSFAATAKVNGNATLETVGTTLTYYSGTGTGGTNLGSTAPVAAGTYTVVASFAGSADYSSASSTPLTFTVAQATPSVTVSDAGGTYTGNGFAATGLVNGNATLETVGTTLTYYSGTGTGGTNLGSTAPIATGTYTVVASFAGSADYLPGTSSPVTFDIVQATPTVTVSDAGGAFTGNPFPATGLVNGNATLETVGTTLTYYSGTGTGGTNLGSTAPSATGTYTVVASFAGSTNYTSASSTPLTFNINPGSAPTVTVSDAGGTYTGNPFPATGLVNGNATLETVGTTLTYYVGTGTGGTNLGSTAPSAVGTYTVVANFPGSADYTSASSSPLTFNITKGIPTVTVSDSGGGYTGNPFSATGLVNGNATLETVGTTLTYYVGTGTGGTNLGSTAPSAVGTYTVVASFAGSTDYNSASSTPLTFNITKGTPSVTVTDAGGTYTGTSFPATSQVNGGATLGGVGTTLKYYMGTGTGGTSLGSAAPIAAGTYTVVASYAGSTNYNSATSTPLTFTIAQVTPTVTVTDAGGTYTGASYPATAKVNGATTLETVGTTLTYYSGTGTGGTNLGSTAPSAAGTYTVVASFAGSTDYSSASSLPMTFSIAKATPTVTVFDAGGTGDGSTIAFPATAKVNGQATLETVAPTLTYYAGSDTSGTNLGSTAPVAFGTYTVVATFPGSTDYNGATSSPATFTITAAQNPLSITGIATGVATNDTRTVNPFAGTTIHDTIIGDVVTVTVTLDDAGKGTFTNASLTHIGFVLTTPGTYTYTGTAADATVAIRNLTFHPTPNRVAPGDTETTTFLVSVTDGPHSISNDSATVVTTSINNPPTILGTVAGQKTTDMSTIKPFSAVQIVDPDVTSAVYTPGAAGQTLATTITLSNAANGSFTAASLTASGFAAGAGGTYTFSGTATQTTAAIDQLVFQPTASQVATGRTVTTTFTISVTDGVVLTPTVNRTTTVIATSNDGPVIGNTSATLRINDNTTVGINPFSRLTISDVSGLSQTVTVSLDNSLKGTFSAASLTASGFTASSTPGSYTFSGTTAQAQTAIRELVFLPTDHLVAPKSTFTTTFTVAVDDGVTTTTNSATAVVTTAVNTLPTISGAVAGQATDDETPIAAFSHVTITDPDSANTTVSNTPVGQNVTVTVTLGNAAQGTLAGGGFTSVAGHNGQYSFTGTAAAATTAIDALTFTPTANRIEIGSTDTAHFTIAVTDAAGGKSVPNSTTTVVVTPVPDTLTGLNFTPRTTLNGPVAARSLVGTFTPVDADGKTDTYTYQFVSGGADNAKFTFGTGTASNELLVAQGVTLSKSTTYNVLVKASDSHGDSVTLPVTIVVGA